MKSWWKRTIVILWESSLVVLCSNRCKYRGFIGNGARAARDARVTYVLSHLSLSIFHLVPSTQTRPKSHADPKSFDKYPVYIFSLAFRYIDNTRVCSELIRSRVLVEYETLPFRVALLPCNHGQTRSLVVHHPGPVRSTRYSILEYYVPTGVTRITPIHAMTSGSSDFISKNGVCIVAL
jgi:hypothetical protein